MSESWGVTAGVYNDVIEVGGRVEGEVERAADLTPAGDRLRAVRLSLIGRVSGQGDPDQWTATAVEVPAGDDGSISARFQLTVPDDGPISYNGVLMQVEWWIDARIDVKRRRDTVFEYPVLIVPRGGLHRYSGPHPLHG